MRTIPIPPQLIDAVEEDDLPARYEWLAALPDRVDDVASSWALDVGEPYVPGGQCAWVAPVRNRAAEELVLKVAWRHAEAEQEADALRLWDGDGAVWCHATRSFDDTTALLLERCTPGTQLKCALSEPEQDVVIADLLRRLWKHEPYSGHPFALLQQMCEDWADAFELDFDVDSRGIDHGLARAGIDALRSLSAGAGRSVLLCTDLHAGNVLASTREPWLAIDPKPFIGDPAYDAVQHMLNCDERLATDPAALATRMANLLDLDSDRVTLWLFARCAQESLHDATMRDPARRLAL